MEHHVVQDYTNVASAENVKVFLRFRPPDVDVESDEEAKRLKEGSLLLQSLLHLCLQLSIHRRFL